MDKFEAKWGKKYPKVISSWRKNWERLTAYFEFSPAIRRMIYTTNIIEGFHRQLRKVLKTKGSFPNEGSLYKILFLIQQRIAKKWDKPIWGWKGVLNELSIIFDERLITI